MGTTYSVGGPFSNFATIADIPDGVFSEDGNILQIYPGTYTWPAADKTFTNHSIVGMGSKQSCIITGSINLGSSSSGENYISGVTINGTASVPAIDVKTPTTRCGMHLSDVVLTTSSLALRNHTPISKVDGGAPATSVRNIWSSCTAGLAANSNVTCISSSIAGSWQTPPVNTQDETKLIGTVDLSYASANAGNMTETVTARTIVS
jgi:hypothetical protein